MLDWVAEKTFEPEVLEFFNHANSFFSINWGDLLTQVLLIVSLGVCGHVCCSAIGERSVAKLITLITVVCCINVVILGVLR